jgi:hypothetical protein
MCCVRDRGHFDLGLKKWTRSRSARDLAQRNTTHNHVYRIFDPYRSESLDGGSSPKSDFRLLNTKFGARGSRLPDAQRAPNFVFSRRKLHLGERPPSSDSLLNGSKIRYTVDTANCGVAANEPFSFGHEQSS